MADPDIIKPKLTGLNLPTTIDVTNGAKAVDFSALAQDVGAGVDSVFVVLDRSYQTSFGRSSSLSFSDSTDSFADGISSKTITFDRSTPAGTYKIDTIMVTDKAGNSTFYSSSELSSLGISTSFQVVSSVSADTTPPKLTGLNLPTTIDVTNGAKAVDFSALAQDVGAGVDSVFVVLDRSYQTSFGRSSSLSFSDSTDSFADGISSKTITFDRSTPAGTYKIDTIMVTDKAGNSTFYSSSELSSLGISTSFQVVDRAATVTATISAPVYVTEGMDTSFPLTLTLRNVSTLSGAVSMSFDTAGSTATNGVDVSVPNYSGTYSVSQSPAGDYRISLPSISVLNDYVAESTETIAIKITAPGQIFDSGTDTTVVTVSLRDNGLVAPPADTTPPTLNGLVLSAPIDLTSGAKTISFAARASDMGSGVDRVVLAFDREFQTSTGAKSSLVFSDSSDSFSDGISSGAVTFAATAAAGTYSVTTAMVYDKAGNVTSYTGSQLAGLGIANSFQLTRQPPTISVSAPTFVTEGNDTSFSLNLTLLNFSSASGTVTLSYDLLSTAVNGVDVSVPNYSGSYLISRSPAGDYALELPSIGVLDDMAVEGVETIAIRITASGQRFDNGTNTKIVTVELRDNDIVGTVGNDVLTGTRLNDGLLAGAGNDVITGGLGNDRIDGGAGVDTAIYAGTRSAANVTFDLLSRAVTVSSIADGNDTVRHVEQFQFSDGLYSFNFANPGTPVLANFNPANGWSSQDSFPRHIADVSGDGYADIIGFGINGVLVANGSAGGRYSSATLVVENFGANQGWTSDDIYHRKLVDVNNDGKADIVGFGIAGIYVSLSTATDFNAPKLSVENFNVANGWSNQDSFTRSLADVNGDGKADVVGFGIAGTYVALGQGDGTFQAPKLAVANFGANQGWTSDNIYSRALADVDGDGKADIVGFGAAGVYVSRGASDGTFGAATLELTNFNPSNGWSSQDRYTRLLADVNGDHRADIVGFGQNGVFVSYALENGRFTAPSFDIANFSQAQGWSSQNSFHRDVFDMNGDGMADIVGFGVGGVMISLNQNEVVI